MQITEERAEGEVGKERAEEDRGGGRFLGIGAGLEMASVQSWCSGPARGRLDVGNGDSVKFQLCRPLILKGICLQDLVNSKLPKTPLIT